MKVAYKAIGREGTSVADTVEASSIAEAVEALRRDGLFVTDAREATGREKRYRGSERVVAPEAGHMRMGELLFFTRQMSMLLKAGSPVVPAMRSIASQVSGPARAVIDKLRRDMEQGCALADSMKQFPNTFSPVYISVVGAGEMTANLNDMFERLAAWVRYKREIRNRILSAVIYPALLINLSIGIVITMVVFVVPRFKTLFESLGADLPASTQVMFSISFFLKAHWMLLTLLVLCVLLGVVLFSYLDRGKQFCADVQTRLPYAGKLFNRLLQAQMFRMMGLLLESRIGIMETLGLSRQISRNRDFQALCKNMHEELERGGRISRGLVKSVLVSPSIAQAISTGEESGHLDQALLFVADVLDDENMQMINTGTKLLEPVILIGMGLVVGAIAMSLFIPLFDLAAMAK